MEAGTFCFGPGTRTRKYTYTCASQVNLLSPSMWCCSWVPYALFLATANDHAKDLSSEASERMTATRARFALSRIETIKLIRIKNEFGMVAALLHKLEPKPGHQQSSSNEKTTASDLKQRIPALTF